MDAKPSRSLFAQRLDRIAFVTYFLGAVVPLGALAVARAGAEESANRGAWTAGMVAIGVLSLGAFLALRRSTREALSRIDGENRRLSALLRSSWSLAAAPDARQAVASAAEESLGLVTSGAAVSLRAEDGGRCTVLDAFGMSDEEARRLADSIDPGTVATAFTEGRATRLEIGCGRTAVLLPLAGIDSHDVLVATIVPTGTLDEATLSGLSTLAGLAGVSAANADLRDAQRNFFSHVTELLASALDAHLGHHHGHGHRVARLANRLGRQVGLNDAQLHRLHFAALLHDIGLLRLPKELHGDPIARRSHARIGFDLLQPIRLWEASAPIVLMHHERWDGDGYPSGVAGEDIPLEARVLSVCDVFDAITSRTAVGERRSVADALQELDRAAGTQLDPRCVEAFRALADQGMLGIEAEASDEITVGA